MSNVLLSVFFFHPLLFTSIIALIHCTAEIKCLHILYDISHFYHTLMSVVLVSLRGESLSFSTTPSLVFLLSHSFSHSSVCRSIQFSSMGFIDMKFDMCHPSTLQQKLINRSISISQKMLILSPAPSSSFLIVLFFVFLIVSLLFVLTDSFDPDTLTLSPPSTFSVTF